jgi:hypothetical protein
MHDYLSYIPFALVITFALGLCLYELCIWIRRLLKKTKHEQINIGKKNREDSYGRRKP